MKKNAATIERRLKFDEWNAALEFASKTIVKPHSDFDEIPFIELLNKNQAMVLRMNYQDELTLSQISKKLGISIHAVMRTRDRALKKIGKKYLMYSLEKY